MSAPSLLSCSPATALETPTRALDSPGPDLGGALLFGDTYTRTGLSLKEREFLTFVVISSIGGCQPQVKAHAAGNLAMGTTRKQLIDAIVVMLPFIGFPKSLNALAMVNEAAPAK